MKPVLLASTLALALIRSAVAAASGFVEVTPQAAYFTTPDSEDFWVNAIAPADVDGDGRLDLVVLGFYVVYDQSVQDMLIVFHNDGEAGDGTWAFTPTDVALDGVAAGASSLALADIDGDGDFDLALGSEGVTVLYRNDAGTLLPVTTTLPGYYEDSSYEDTYDLRSLAFADVDNDGDPDLLIPSVYDAETFSYRTVLMRNDGSDGGDGWLFTEVPTQIAATRHAQSAWSDADGDGDVDLMLANADPFLETGFVGFYENDAGTLTETQRLDVRLEHGLADVADVDGDGDLDVLVAGNVFDSDEAYRTVLRVYRKQDDIYVADTLLQAPGNDWLDFNAATWADYDSDGDVDLLVTGTHVANAEIVGKSEIYANDGGIFTAIDAGLEAPIGSVGRGGAFTWFDLDGDGDLDYLVAGAFFVPGGNGLVEARMRLFRNMATAANRPPSVPADLAVQASVGGVELSWQAASDDHTGPTQLTYDVQLWHGDVPASLPERLPRPGTLGATTHSTLGALPEGHYRWSVRAVDAAYAGSAAASGAFTLPLLPDRVFSDGFDA